MSHSPFVSPSLSLSIAGTLPFFLGFFPFSWLVYYLLDTSCSTFSPHSGAKDTVSVHLLIDSWKAKCVRVPAARRRREGEGPVMNALCGCLSSSSFSPLYFVLSPEFNYFYRAQHEGGWKKERKGESLASAPAWWIVAECVHVTLDRAGTTTTQTKTRPTVFNKIQTITLCSLPSIGSINSRFFFTFSLFRVVIDRLQHQRYLTITKCGERQNWVK